MGDFIRLQKILAQAGFGSRRACEAFILEGRVTVDGAVIRHLGSKADPETQVVTLDGEKVAGPGKAGKRLKGQSARVYYALNKPVGVLCTNEDPSGRPLAIQMVPDKRRLFCVGRLDLDTEGLLLLTNDGELTHLLTHPRFGVPKTYVAKVSGMVSAVQLAKLKKGVFLAEGRTRGAMVRLRKKGKNTSTLELTIQEGLNRQIRRMLAAVGLQCRNLRRVRIGPLALGAMPSGAYRQLGREEVDALRLATKEKKGASGEPGAEPEVGEDRDRTEAPKSCEDREHATPKRRTVQRSRDDRDRGKKSHPRREKRPYTRSSDSDHRERRETRHPRQEKRPYRRSSDSDRWEHDKKSRPRREKKSHTRSRDRDDRDRGEQSRSYEKRPYKKRSDNRDDWERGEKRRPRSQPYKKRSNDRHDGERGEKSRSRSERQPYKKRGGDRDDRPARQERRGRPKEPGHRSKSGRGYGDERTGRGKRPAKRNEDRRSSSQERNRGRKPEQRGRGRRREGN